MHSKTPFNKIKYTSPKSYIYVHYSGRFINRSCYDIIYNNRQHKFIKIYTVATRNCARLNPRAEKAFEEEAARVDVSIRDYPGISGSKDRAAPGSVVGSNKYANLHLVRLV